MSVGRTRRFGFSTFGPRDGGSIGADGGKFSDADRHLLDTVLAAYESHTHDQVDGGRRLDDPTAEVTATLEEGGSLAGGPTYYYAITLLDPHGMETAAGPVVEVETPAPLTTPRPPSLTAATGGTLAAGMFYYGFTAVTSSGGETPLSAPGVVTLLPGDGAVNVAVPPIPDGASGLRIWRMGPTANGYTKLAVVSAEGDWVDDGSIPDNACACDPENLPPSHNLTSARWQVKVDISGVDLTGASAWRLYRSTVQGVFGGQSLVHEVVETSDEGGLVLLTEWTDEGGALLYGGPPQVSQTLATSVPFTTPELETLPATAPHGFTALHAGVPWVRQGDAWGQVVLAVSALPPAPIAGVTVVHGDVMKQWTGLAWKTLSGGGGDPEPEGALWAAIEALAPTDWWKLDAGSLANSAADGGLLGALTSSATLEAGEEMVGHPSTLLPPLSGRLTSTGLLNEYSAESFSFMIVANGKEQMLPGGMPPYFLYQDPMVLSFGEESAGWQWNGTLLTTRPSDPCILVVTIDGSSKTMYASHTPDPTVDTLSPTSMPSAQFIIGDSDAEYYPEGYPVSNIAFWNRALSAGEVATLLAADAGGEGEEPGGLEWGLESGDNPFTIGETQVTITGIEGP